MVEDGSARAVACRAERHEERHKVPDTGEHVQGTERASDTLED